MGLCIEIFHLELQYLSKYDFELSLHSDILMRNIVWNCSSVHHVSGGICHTLGEHSLGSFISI
jgi:hypothetical protein